MKTGRGMTDLQLCDEVMILFLGDHETNAMAMAWLLGFVLRDDVLKEKLLKEIKTIKDS